MAESRGGRDVDEHLETKAAVLRLRADRLEKEQAQVELGQLSGVSTAGDLSDGGDDRQRKRQTDGHQTDVDKHPDELFDAARLQRVPLSPSAIGCRSPLASARQAYDHDDSADDYRPDRQQLGHGFVECRPHLLLEEDALAELVLRERTRHRCRLARC